MRLVTFINSTSNHLQIWFQQFGKMEYISPGSSIQINTSVYPLDFAVSDLDISPEYVVAEHLTCGNTIHITQPFANSPGFYVPVFS